MENQTLTVSPAIHHAFKAFTKDSSLLAFPLIFSGGVLEPLPAIPYPKNPRFTFQAALAKLEDVLSPNTPLFLIIRRDVNLIAITFAPYLAKRDSRTWLLENRQALVQQLGRENFSSSLICKEIAEITDARSWEERGGHGKPWNENASKSEECESCEGQEEELQNGKDLGYKQNQCRLCDRRMKNKITDDALDALAKLDQPGSCVQISVDITSETLQLNFHKHNISTSQITSHLPNCLPSFTFYRHPTNNLLYFIFCSPDSATVQQRMKHTMAIPGLVNIIAQDNDVRVDQKIEIHEPEELSFENRDDRVGRFRSMYLRGDNLGTESTYENIEADKRFWNEVR